MWWIRCEKQMVWNVWIAVLTAPWPFVLSYQYPHRASLHRCTTQWVERQGQDCCHAPFDWLWLGFSAQPHPKGLAGKQEEGPETAHIIPASISNHRIKLDPSEARMCCHVSAGERKQATSKSNIPISTCFNKPEYFFYTNGPDSSSLISTHTKVNQLLKPFF